MELSVGEMASLELAQTANGTNVLYVLPGLLSLEGGQGLAAPGALSMLGNLGAAIEAGFAANGASGSPLSPPRVTRPAAAQPAAVRQLTSKDKPAICSAVVRAFTSRTAATGSFVPSQQESPHSLRNLLRKLLPDEAMPTGRQVNAALGKIYPRCSKERGFGPERDRGMWLEATYRNVGHDDEYNAMVRELWPLQTLLTANGVDLGMCKREVLAVAEGFEMDTYMPGLRKGLRGKSENRGVKRKAGEFLAAAAAGGAGELDARLPAASASAPDPQPPPQVAAGPPTVEQEPVESGALLGSFVTVLVQHGLLTPSVEEQARAAAELHAAQALDRSQGGGSPEA